MSQMIQRSADMLHQEWNKKLYMADTSDSNGGHIRPHASHQMGVDADIAYPSDVRGLKFPLVVNKNTRAYFPNNYSVGKTFELFKFYFSQPDIQVDRIFVDQRIITALCDYAKTQHETTGSNRDLVKKMFENMQHVRGHGDHFHLRLKCSPYDPGCRARVYRKMPACR
jgi:murein endopeptidase